MKKAVAVVAVSIVVSAALVACGGGSGGNTAGITGVERKAEEQTRDENQVGADETAAESTTEAIFDKASLFACIQKTGLEYVEGSGTVPGGEEYRAVPDWGDTEFVGFVVWPSGSLIDFWIGADSEAAEDAKAGVAAFAGAAGREDEVDDFIQVVGNMMIALGDEMPPTPDEVEMLNPCLEG
ncbi:MAG: hypothetical protein R2725_05995 [Solirubrobacterales bacterium]